MKNAWVSPGSILAGLWLGLHIVSGAVSVCDEASLRAAVAGGGHITFNCDGLIVLTSPLIVTQDIVLNATGRNVTISGNDQVRIFEVGYGHSLHLINLTIRQGRAQGTNGLVGGGTSSARAGGPGVGGAVFFTALGSISATDCRFLNNQAIGGKGADAEPSDFIGPGDGGHGLGGAIAGNAAVYLTNCVFNGNSATGGAGGFQSRLGHAFFGIRGNGLGGAIQTGTGIFVAQNCQFSTNGASTAAGALHLLMTQATLSNCLFAANLATGRAGAILQDGMPLTVRNSIFTSNRAGGRPAQGGGIVKASGELTLERCEFAGNSAVGDVGFTAGSGRVEGGDANGGALYIGGGPAVINDCTFASNAVQGGAGCCPFPPGPAAPGRARGGAIYTQAPTTIRNGTFAHNAASAGVFSPGSFPLFDGAMGGAIFCDSSELRIEYSTIASNAVNNFTNSVHGGGLVQCGGLSQLISSILSGNTTNGVFGENVYPTMVNGSSNLSSDTTGGGGLSSFNIDPKLGPLADNGGPVRTMALLAGSPAIDAAVTATCIPADARGMPRGTVTAKCDIGAFEQTFMRLYIDPGLNAVVNYFGVPNETYALEMSFDLINWDALPPQPSGGGFMAWSFPGTARSVFFRVKLLP
jgi:hypothetical protein